MAAKKYKMPSKTKVRRLLKYLPEAGQFLWRKDRGAGAKAGQVAGFMAVDGTWRIILDGQMISAHVLAWIYVYGERPPGLLRHKNGIRDDNRIENIEPIKDSTERTLEDLEARCDIVGECWHWKGAKSHGSPQMRFQGKVIQVRAYMFTELLRKRRTKPYISSSCDSLDCIAPKHIAEYTRAELQKRSAERTQYAQSPMRRRRLSEAAVRRSPYSDEFVAQVRAMEGSSKAVARELGLCPSTVIGWRSGEHRAPTNGPWAGLLAA